MLESRAVYCSSRHRRFRGRLLACSRSLLGCLLLPRLSAPALPPVNQCAYDPLIPVSLTRPSPQDPAHPVNRCNLIQRPSQSGSVSLLDAPRLRDHIRYRQPSRGWNIHSVVPTFARQRWITAVLLRLTRPCMHTTLAMPPPSTSTSNTTSSTTSTCHIRACQIRPGTHM